MVARTRGGWVVDHDIGALQVAVHQRGGVQVIEPQDNHLPIGFDLGQRERAASLDLFEQRPALFDTKRINTNAPAAGESWLSTVHRHRLPKHAPEPARCIGT